MTQDMVAWLEGWQAQHRAKHRAGLDVTRKGPWLYTGDMDLQHGGMFFKPVDEFGMIRAVEVTPCSTAGGPDNRFVIEDGYLHAGDPDEWQSSLDVCGYKLHLCPDGDGFYAIEDCTGVWHDVRGPDGTILLADAVRGAKGFDDRQETVIQIGKNDPFYDYDRAPGWTPEPDTILHGNTKLRTYVAKDFL